MRVKFKSVLLLIGFVFIESTAFAGEKCPVIDVVIGKLKPGIDEKKFLADSTVLDIHLKKQKGFISRKFYKVPETNQWMDILCWKTEEEGKKAVEVVHATPACNTFLGQWEEKYDLFHGIQK